MLMNLKKLNYNLWKICFSAGAICLNTSLLTLGSETLSDADNCFIFYSVFQLIKRSKLNLSISRYTFRCMVWISTVLKTLKRPLHESRWSRYFGRGFCLSYINIISFYVMESNINFQTLVQKLGGTKGWAKIDNPIIIYRFIRYIRSICFNPNLTSP